MKTAILCLAVLLPGSPQEREDVEALLKRDGWKAVRDLVHRGEELRPALGEASKSKDPDISFFGSAARAELEFYARKDLPVAPPTRAFEGPASEAAVSLFKSAGLVLEAGGLPDRRIALPAGLTVAEAVERLARELDAEFVSKPEGHWIAEGKYRKGPRFASGRSLAALASCARYSGRELGRGVDRSIGLEGEVRLVGRIPRAVLFGDLRVLEARDDRGADLRDDRDRPDLGVSEDQSAGFHLSLRALSPGATRIRRLRMKADLAVAGRRGEIAFPLGAENRGVTKTAGGLTAVLDRTFWEGGEYRVVISIRGRGLRGRMGKDDVRLLDAAGKAWTRTGSPTGGTGDEDVSWTVAFGNPGDAGEPARLVCSIIVETFVHSVYFEFPEFELP